MRHPRLVLYGASGLLLALGAPAGWLLLCLLRGELSGVTPGQALSAQRLLYGYLTVGTGLAFGLFGALLGRLSDRLMEANQQLRELSITDGLTALKNARYFREALQQACDFADRSGTPLTLVMVDLDHFKRVNDEFGHAIGDRVLAHAARAILANVRSSDIACRVGGEEFAIICPDSAPEAAGNVAERIRACLQATPVSEAGGRPVTASFGLALRGARLTPDALFRRADAALYDAKQQGRNRVCLSLEEKAR